MSFAVVIIAGGLGTRLRGVVPDVPKPLAPVAGRPFLEHLMDRWIGQGAAQFVLSVGYRHELIEAHFGNAYKSVPVHYAIEKEPLGTGGGLLLALEAVPGADPVFAVNGDTFFAVDAVAMRRFHDSNRSEVTLALFRTLDTTRYTPITLESDGRIPALAPGAAGGSSYANGGVFIFERAAIARTGFRAGDRVVLETELIARLIERGARLFGFPSEAIFIDIGAPEDYARAASVVDPAG